MRITDVSQLNGTLISTARPCPDLSLVEFLRRTHGQRRIHWESRRSSLAFAGYGAVVDLISEGTHRFTHIQALIEKLFDGAVFSEFAQPRLFGGFSFRDDFVPQVVWHGMAAGQFVLPAVMLLRDGEQSWLILSRYIQSHLETEQKRLEQDIDTLFDELFWNFSGEHWNPEWEDASDIEYPMDFQAWKSMVTHATEQMSYGLLEKVVLARMCQIRFSGAVNVVRALEYLREVYPDTHRFLFEPEPHNAFYGATPETLIHVNNEQVYADALAGTIRRGESDLEDQQLAAKLFDDPKERREHRYVVEGIRKQLIPYTDTLQVDNTPHILKLSNVQHLHTPITGKLKDQCGILSLLESLHPTPALGGQPHAVSDPLINQLEPITRGWYASPIGWVDHNLNGHFGVGIRSAVSRGGIVWCYAGAGIVAESDPEREWVETDLKFRPMLNAVGVMHAHAKP